MKVIFTVDTIINAGTERSILELIPAFSKDIEVKVVYFYPPHDLLNEYQHAGIPLVFAGLKGKYEFLKGVKFLRKLIREENPDVIVSSVIRADFISRLACKLTGTKLIGTFISDAYKFDQLENFPFKQKISTTFYHCIDRLTAKIPVGWISNSESIKYNNAHALGLDSKKIKVVYRGRNAVNFHQWTPPPDKNIFRFVTAGRLLKSKGFDNLIIAFKKVNEVHKETRLEIYGEGPYRTKLSRLIQRLNLQDSIFLRGSVLNVTHKLYECNCFVFPSAYEGFSGALIEAMMTGIPIIASDIPMNLEALTQGKTALIHKAKDPESICRKMLRMISTDNEMYEMGKMARAEAIRRFDIKNIARQYESVIASTVINAG